MPALYADLNDYIVSPKKIYIEAFLKNGSNYAWKSITHAENTISKGTKWTTSIVVQ